MSHWIVEKLDKALADADKKLENSSNSSEIEDVRIEMIGRNGLIPALAKEMKNVPSEQKPEVGKAFNSAKKRIQTLLNDAKKNLNASAEEHESTIDITLPGRKNASGQKHPITGLIDECVEIFRRMGFIALDGPEIETIFNNFDALNTPDDHPSRDLQDTFYFDDDRLLRTQTSPVQIRTMMDEKPPIRIIAPGRCFRRDTPDATHSMNFHQIEGLYVDENVSLANLKSVLLEFAHELFGTKVDIRLRPHFFPFTEPSVEVDFSCMMCEGDGCRVCKNSGWLEIAGAGMVDPNVLNNVNYDSEKWTGYAFGMGIERLAMIKYRINDIRLLYENDIRFLKQF